MKSWIVKVKFPDRSEFWAGTFYAPGRTEAKTEARRFCSRHFPLDSRILGISRGSITVKTEGEFIPMEDEELTAT